MTSGIEEGWFLEVEDKRIDLREGEVTLGRSRGCGVVLRDPSVSRGHALLSVRQGRVTLQDLRSSNGTYVNGKRLEKETALEGGDRVVIGETELFLHRAQSGGAAEGPRTATGEVSLHCPTCGLPIHGAAGGRCPGCGAELASWPRRLVPREGARAGSSAAPVPAARGATPRDGVPAQEPGRPGVVTPLFSLPTPRPPLKELPEMQAATPEGTAAALDDAPSPDPVSTAETRPRDVAAMREAALFELPMSVREAELEPAPRTAERSGAVPRPSAFPPPPPGLWSRLARYFRGSAR